MIRYLWMYLIWYFIFDLVDFATRKQSIPMLGLAILCSYIVAVRLFPFFPYNNKEEENN